jgi:pilus assembly protein CpaE
MAGATEAGGESQKIRVLIVDDIPETRENLRKLLFFESDVEVVAAATSGEEGIVMAGQLTPDVVLMDINMPGVDGITATKAITQQLPSVQVIMMSVQGETDYLRRSMHAGAREFLVKPFTGDDLVSAIRRTYELGLTRQHLAPAIGLPSTPAHGGREAGPAEQGKIVTVFSAKGGSGCSTLAINMAIALLRLKPGNKVALLDCSLQFGDIAVLLNLQAARSIADLVPHIDELDSDLLETVLVTHASGIRALLAPPRPELADRIGPGLLDNVLNMLRCLCTYIVVDTASTLSDVTLTVLDAADRVALVATPDIPAIKDAKLFFEVTDALEYPASKTILILNKADPHNSIRAEDIQASIKHPVAVQIPFDERTATVAVNQGVPYMVGARSTKLAQATTAMAQHVASTVAEQEEMAEAPSRIAAVRLIP